MQITERQLNAMAKDGSIIGFHKDIENEVYHSGPGFSSSNIIYVAKYSLAQFMASHKRPTEPSIEMNFGVAGHLAILEPKLFKKKVTYLPRECKGNSGSAIKSKELFLKAHSDKIIVESEEKYNSISDMADSVNDFLAHSEVPDLLSKGESETSCYNIDEEFGCLVKCRPDKLHRSIGLSVNLKTSWSVLEYDFQKTIMEYYYHWSSSMYIDLLSSLLKINVTELHLIVEPEHPHRVSLRCLDEGSLDKGRQDYRNILKQMSEANRSKVWKAIQSISIPHWGMYK